MKFSPVMVFCVSSCHIVIKYIHRKVFPELEMGREMSIPSLIMGLCRGEDAASLLSTHDVQGKG